MYRGQTGMWAWMLHRITGIGVLLFLIVHIVDISLLGFGPTVYNEGIALFGTTVVRVVSLALIGALLYHAFNGIRILFWTAMILTIVCFLPMAYFVIAPIFGVNAGNTASGV